MCRVPSKFYLLNSVAFNQSTYCRFTGTVLSLQKSFYVSAFSFLLHCTPTPLLPLHFKFFTLWLNPQHQTLQTYILQVLYISHKVSALLSLWPITSLSFQEWVYRLLICTMQIKEVTLLFSLCLAVSKASELVIHNVICGCWDLCVCVPAWLVNVCVTLSIYEIKPISPLAPLSPWLASVTDRSRLSANSARLDQRHTRTKIKVRVHT